MKDRMNKKKKKLSSNASHHRRAKKRESIKKKIYKVAVSETVDEKLTVNEIKHEDKQNEDSDPFKRTGCLFGGLFKEMKNRYSQYLSDLRDGFNMHCFIAFIFIFTVCFAPALTFGGILGKKN